MNEAITEVSIRSDTGYLDRVRRVITCIADRAGMDQKESYDAKLAVTEACANAIRHGSNGHASDRITIRISSESGRFVAEVSDSGDGFDPAEVKPAPGPRVGGYGIQLMKRLTDEVEFSSGCDGTTVRLTKHVRRPPGFRHQNNLR